jgi:hypothetical protein
LPRLAQKFANIKAETKRRSYATDKVYSMGADEVYAMGAEGLRAILSNCASKPEDIDLAISMMEYYFKARLQRARNGRRIESWLKRSAASCTDGNA